MVNQRSTNTWQFGTDGINTSFDLDAAIVSLLNDSGCHSLELPRCLTPEQRSQAKLVAKQYPELKCESYGFGVDRRLHVFKKSATTCVRVKNTFVDGWAADNGEDNVDDAIIFRSEPGNLWVRAALSSGDGRLELPPLCAKTLCPIVLDDKPSPAPAETMDLDEQSSSSPATPEGRQDPPFPPGNFDTFPLGSLVVIKGLVRAPAFNGCVGVVHSLDAETGRYDVLLAAPTSGRQWAKVKYENLRPAHGGDMYKT